MKKRVIAIVLFLFCGLILSGSVFNSKEDYLESSVRNIVLEDKKLDLSYYENKYDIYNEENTCFEITESYQPNTILGKNSENSELEVQFYAFVNKEEQYFIFSYKGIIDEKVVISSKVIIDLIEYEGTYYLVSSNGSVALFEEVIEENTKANCCSTAYFGETLGLGGLSGFSDIKVGAGGGGSLNGYQAAGMAVGAVAVGALAAASNNNRSSGVSGGLLPLPNISNISEDRKNPKKPDASSNDSDSSKDIPNVDVKDLPENAQEAFKKYDKAGWKGNVSGQTEGTKAGGNWNNKDDQLPKTDEEGNPITYKEYDVNNFVNGEERDTERFVRGSDGSVYYTDSHYGQGESKYGFPPFVRLR